MLSKNERSIILEFQSTKACLMLASPGMPEYSALAHAYQAAKEKMKNIKESRIAALVKVMTQDINYVKKNPRGKVIACGIDEKLSEEAHRAEEQLYELSSEFGDAMPKLDSKYIQ